MDALHLELNGFLMNFQYELDEPLLNFPRRTHNRPDCVRAVFIRPGRIEISPWNAQLEECLNRLRNSQDTFQIQLKPTPPIQAINSSTETWEQYRSNQIQLRKFKKLSKT